MRLTGHARVSSSTLDMGIFCYLKSVFIRAVTGLARRLHFCREFAKNLDYDRRARGTTLRPDHGNGSRTGRARSHVVPLYPHPPRP